MQVYLSGKMVSRFSARNSLVYLSGKMVCQPSIGGICTARRIVLFLLLLLVSTNSELTPYGYFGWKGLRGFVPSSLTYIYPYIHVVYTSGCNLTATYVLYVKKDDDVDDFST